MSNQIIKMTFPNNDLQARFMQYLRLSANQIKCVESLVIRKGEDGRPELEFNGATIQAETERS